MFNSLKNMFLRRLIKVLDNHYQRLDSVPHHVAIEFLNYVADDAMTKVIINDVSLLMPARYLRYLRKIPQSHQYDKDHPLRYNVERPHSEWMVSKLAVGANAVDIGASAGAVTAKLSKAVGEKGSVVSFEPARFSMLDRS